MKGGRDEGWKDGGMNADSSLVFLPAGLFSLHQHCCHTRNRNSFRESWTLLFEMNTRKRHIKMSFSVAM